MPADSVKVTGLAELGRAMDKAPQNFERFIMGNATKSAGQVWLDSAKAKVPVAEGDLKRAIVLRTKIIAKTKLGFGIGNAIVGVLYRGLRAATGRYKPGRGTKPSSEDPGVYALFVEMGRPNRSGHTHQAAQPFLRPTFDGESDAAIKKFADTVTRQLGDLVR